MSSDFRALLLLLGGIFFFQTIPLSPVGVWPVSSFTDENTLVIITITPRPPCFVGIAIPVEYIRYEQTCHLTFTFCVYSHFRVSTMIFIIHVSYNMYTLLLSNMLVCTVLHYFQPLLKRASLLATFALWQSSQFNIAKPITKRIKFMQMPLFKNTISLF